MKERDKKLPRLYLGAKKKMAITMFGFEDKGDPCYNCIYNVL